jgi:hypothetical protein
MLAYDSHIGRVSNPNDGSTPLASRYSATGMTLGVTVDSYALQFSTGLTRPVIMECNENNAPATQPDSIVLCVSPASRAAKAAVLENDTDADNNTIYVTGVRFVNPLDSNLAELAVSATSDTVILTLKPDAVISGEHIFNITYDVKDDGLPASQCATGSLKVKAYPVPELTSPLTLNTCSGSTFTYTATTAVTGTTFAWSRAAVPGISELAANDMGANISETLTNTTKDPLQVIYTITLTGAENCTKTQEITVTVNPLCAADDYVTVSCDASTNSIDVLANDSMSCTPVTVAIVEDPKHGTASVNASNNTISYTADNQSGLDSLTYSISCGGTSISEAKVYITVSAPVSGFVDDVWYFGKNDDTEWKSAGIRFVKEQGGYVAQDASNESNVNSWENSLVVSSPYCDGPNIFYSSHKQLYNSRHEPMLNGSFAGHSSTADGLAACYMGDNKYLFFSVTDAYPTPESPNPQRGLKAYIVDMNADNGRGARVDSITIESATDNFMSESVELIAHAGTDNQYWLIYAYRENDNVSLPDYSNVLRIRPVDVSNPVVASIVGAATSIPKTSSRTYRIVASPQQNRVAVMNFDNGTVDIFDFNNSTGDLSLRHTINHEIMFFFAYGLEFSPDGNQLYMSEYKSSSSTPARLFQYNISTNTVVGSPVQYWSQTVNEIKGGGLKLGPDGKIYVTQSFTDKVGVISDPDSTTSLSSRYNVDALTLTNLDGTYDGIQFSTGLTRPAVIACSNTNNAPTATPDEAIMCVSTSQSVKVNVLKNDEDADVGDTIFLTNAYFVNPSDNDLATLTVDAADSTVTLTLKSGVNIGMEHIFDIIYDVKDDGSPASQCATGSLKVKAYSTLHYPDIRVSVCSNVGMVKLSKYLDTVGVVGSILWESRIPGIPIVSPEGKVSTANLSSSRIHTFTYTLSSWCVSDQQRMLYLEVLKDDMKRRLKDTVAICYLYADAIHIDQIFGIEANGSFSYPSAVNQYVSQSSSGATIMNGKAIYENNAVSDYNYHGAVAKKIEVTYTPDIDSCLAGKTYTVVIILTSSN